MARITLLAPLMWPEGAKRSGGRRDGMFWTPERRHKDRKLLIVEGVARIRKELDHWGVPEAEISANFARTRTGVVTADLERDAEIGGPGAVLSFRRKGIDYLLPCDTYTQLAQNLAALAADLEAKRAILRYGVTSLEDVMRYAELPSSGSPAAVRGWRAVLEMDTAQGSKESLLILAERQYRTLAKREHPDQNGNTPQAHAKMIELNAAIEAARQELGE